MNFHAGGDIAKQMPLEAKKFLKVDRDFVKLMNKAEATQIVLQCCANELLKNTLPVLYDELERCVSRRFEVLRRLDAIDATRVQERRSWVVSFSSLRPFGPI